MEGRVATEAWALGSSTTMGHIGKVRDRRRDRRELQEDGDSTELTRRQAERKLEREFIHMQEN